MTDPIRSRPYSIAMACEACVFGRGEHMPGCRWYTCSMCGGVFESTWTPEERDAEAEEIFGKHPKDWKDESVSVCDDCFRLINPAGHPDKVAEARRYL